MFWLLNDCLNRVAMHKHVTLSAFENYSTLYDRNEWNGMEQKTYFVGIKRERWFFASNGTLAGYIFIAVDDFRNWIFFTF